MPEAEGFALAGGAGLIVHQVTQRTTNDLDFFTPDAGHVARLLPALEEALRADDLQVTRIRSTTGFARLAVEDREQATVVDLASDYRLRLAVDTAPGKVVAPEELAADKLLALAGRIEARDYVDVSRLVGRYGLERVCELAGQKDPGFQRWALADMLRHFDRSPTGTSRSTTRPTPRSALRWPAGAPPSGGAAPEIRAPGPEHPGLGL